jgi:hypothetical protein
MVALAIFSSWIGFCTPSLADTQGSRAVVLAKTPTFHVLKDCSRAVPAGRVFASNQLVRVVTELVCHEEIFSVVFIPGGDPNDRVYVVRQKDLLPVP